MLKSFQVLSENSIITDWVGNNRSAHLTPPSSWAPFVSQRHELLDFIHFCLCFTLVFSLCFVLNALCLSNIQQDPFSLFDLQVSLPEATTAVGKPVLLHVLWIDFWAPNWKWVFDSMVCKYKLLNCPVFFFSFGDKRWQVQSHSNPVLCGKVNTNCIIRWSESKYS